jgi:hypothetical protein
MGIYNVVIPDEPGVSYAVRADSGIEALEALYGLPHQRFALVGTLPETWESFIPADKNFIRMPPQG